MRAGRGVVLATMALGACAAPQAPRVAAPPPPVHMPAAAGLARVMGQSAPALVALFGQPALDVTEGSGRRLQFRGPACTLDAYLYPPERGGAPAVRWIDARTPPGADMDRASCVAALARR